MWRHRRKKGDSVAYLAEYRRHALLKVRDRAEAELKKRGVRPKAWRAFDVRPVGRIDLPSPVLTIGMSGGKSQLEQPHTEAWDIAAAAAVADAALKAPPTHRACLDYWADIYADVLAGDPDARRKLRRLQEGNSKGGRARAEQRRRETAKHVEDWQAEYLDKMKQAQGKPPNVASRDVIETMARRYGYTPDYMRRRIKPLTLRRKHAL